MSLPNPNPFNPNLGISAETLPFVMSAWDMVTTTLEAKGAIDMLALLANREEGSIMFVPPRGIPTKEMYASIIAMVVRAQNEDIPEDAPQSMRMMLDMMIKSMKEGGAVIHPDLVLHVSEAWMVQVDLKKSAAQVKAEIEEAHRIGASQHPDRIEVVIIGWKTDDGEEGHHIRKLLRDGEGKPSLGEYLMNDQMGRFTSRFLENVFTKPVVPAEKKH